MNVSQNSNLKVTWQSLCIVNTCMTLDYMLNGSNWVILEPLPLFKGDHLPDPYQLAVFLNYLWLNVTQRFSNVQGSMYCSYEETTSANPRRSSLGLCGRGRCWHIWAVNTLMVHQCSATSTRHLQATWTLDIYHPASRFSNKSWVYTVHF